MSVDINVGPEFMGYPFLKQGGTFTSNAMILGEDQHTDYKRRSTDQLGQIQRSNGRDAIGDLDSVLRNADVNAIDPDFYGAHYLQTVSGSSEGTTTEGMTTEMTIKPAVMPRPLIEYDPDRELPPPSYFDNGDGLSQGTPDTIGMNPIGGFPHTDSYEPVSNSTCDIYAGMKTWWFILIMVVAACIMGISIFMAFRKPSCSTNELALVRQDELSHLELSQPE